MLNEKELEELKFFADKVATVHGPDHGEYITVNEIVKDIEDEESVSADDLGDLRELTKNYVIPEWACKAQTTLLNLLKKMDNK
jgi:iron-sulfur cluster repair protein YtfE (RIC family)